MTQSVNSVEVFVPPPIAGMDTENPFADYNAGYARLIHNAVIDGGRMIQRFAQQKYSSPGGAPSGTARLLWIDIANNQYLWSDGVIRNFAGTLLYASTILSQPSESVFRDQLYLFYTGNAAIRRNGLTAWTVFPFTLAVETPSSLTGGFSYKNRAYFHSALSIEYANTVNGISGTCSNFPLESLLDGAGIYTVRVCTINQGLQSEVVVCVFAFNGLVLIYSGDYPGSQNWQLVGQFKIPPLINRFAFIDIDGDTLVMTRDCIYSVRDLMSGGAEQARNNSLCNPVGSLYKSMARHNLPDTPAPGTTFGTYIKFHDALVFQMCSLNQVFSGSSLDPVNDEIYCQLVYLRRQKAWVLWTLPQLTPGVKDLTDFTGIVWPMQQAVLSYQSSGVLAYDKLEPNNSLITVATYRGVEVEWRTPYFQDRKMQNCRSLAVRPIYSCDQSVIVPPYAQIRAAGVLVDFADFLSTANSVLYVREQTLTMKSVQAWTGIKNSSIYDPYLPIGYQSRFASLVARLNDFDEGNVTNVTTSGAFYGMYVYLEPGGAL